MAIDPASTAYTDLQALGSLKHAARAERPEALREAARQFESVFTRMMLESMRSASMGDSLFDSQESGFYRDMFDDQLAVEMSRGKGLGLAEVLVRQLQQAGVAAGSAAASPGAAPPAATPPAAATGKAPSPLGGSPEAFVERMLPAVEKAAGALGVAPRALLAQAALETGWGASMPTGADGRASFNLFGIKASGNWQGDAVGSRTLEFVDGVAEQRVERFRAYRGPDESVADYANLIGRSSRYAAARGTGDDVAAFAQALQRGGYATDPRYAQKLTAVAETVGRLMDARLKGGNSLPIQQTVAAGVSADA
jgi:flagellar protein FlgJ